jgi:sialate O-acetylesterase
VRDQEVRGSSLVIRFHHAESGLMTATKKGLSPPQETPDSQPRLFEVADREGCWHPATARIEGATVIVASDAVARPVAARYAYAVTPDACSLYNRDGLPASPFCTDPALVPYDPQLPE